MASVRASDERIINIKRFLGLNENPDGDVNLKMGEAVEMSNFKITNDGSLQVRGGTKNVAGLVPNGQYRFVISSGTENLVTEKNSAAFSFTAFQDKAVAANGLIALIGDSVQVNYVNWEGYTGRYYQNAGGKTYQFAGCSLTKPGSFAVPGGSVNFGDEELIATAQSLVVRAGVKISGGVIMSDVPFTEWRNTSNGLYTWIIGDRFYMITRIDGSKWYARPVTAVYDDIYEWKFHAVTTTTDITETAIRGIWSGYVQTNEYLVAACSGVVWALSKDSGGQWSKTEIGLLDTENEVFFFGYNSKLYMLNGKEYKVWNGAGSIIDVAGYAPLIQISTRPDGSEGTKLQNVNKLTGSKRQKFSPDGTSMSFQLAEKGISGVDYVKLNDQIRSDFTCNLISGVVTFTTTKTISDPEGNYQVPSPPLTGVNTLEIQWTKGVGERSNVLKMRYAEFYNGAQDTRVFLYGDGSNKALYSGLDEDGKPSAEYFPEDNEMEVGDSNTPLTGLVRHYNMLLAFKEDSAYSVCYKTVMLSDNTETAGFIVTPINRAIGNSAPGQAMLVENDPRTVDGRSIYEWLGITGDITNDQRNAKRISQNVETTLKSFDLKKSAAYFDKINHEYYLTQDGKAIVQNTVNGTWYVYRDFPASCMIVYKDEVYLGTFDGYIRHFSRDYLTDNGNSIAAYWESGSMDFGADYKVKSSPMLWVGLKPEKDAAVNVTVHTDAQSDFSDESIIADYTEPAANGIFSFFDLDFSDFSFGTGNKPHTRRLKINAKRFTYYKLIFTSRPESRATILSADFKVRYTGNVR